MCLGQQLGLDGWYAEYETTSSGDTEETSAISK